VGLRVVRVLRLARMARVAPLTRGLRLLNVFSSLNRGMQALGQNLGRRGFGYMVGLSLLCWVLALYSFAVFGYVTASLASFFVGRDADHDGAALAGQASLRDLRAEIIALREEVRTLAGRRV
jgi:voltage-gated potassium channel